MYLSRVEKIVPFIFQIVQCNRIDSFHSNALLWLFFWLFINNILNCTVTRILIIQNVTEYHSVNFNSNSFSCHSGLHLIWSDTEHDLLLNNVCTIVTCISFLDQFDLPNRLNGNLFTTIFFCPFHHFAAETWNIIKKKRLKSIFN